MRESHAINTSRKEKHFWLKKARRIFILRLKLNNSRWRWKWREWKSALCAHNTKECESYFIQVKLGWIMYFYLYSTTSSIVIIVVVVVVIIIFVCWRSLSSFSLSALAIPHSTAQCNNALSMENSFVEQTTAAAATTKSGKKFLIMSVWLERHTPPIHSKWMLSGCCTFA